MGNPRCDQILSDVDTALRTEVAGTAIGFSYTPQQGLSMTSACENTQVTWILGYNADGAMLEIRRRYRSGETNLSMPASAQEAILSGLAFIRSPCA